MTQKYYTCPHCRENTPIRSFAPDRVELERERGERFPVTCRHCEQQSLLHVNQVKARANHLVTYLVTAFCLLCWVFILLSGLYRNIYLLLAASGILGLPVAVRSAVEKGAESFNGYQIIETPA